MPGGERMVAFGMNAIAPDSESQAESVEMVVKRHLGLEDMDAHERVLTDAMAGDATRFARQGRGSLAYRGRGVEGRYPGLPVLDVAARMLR
jgi:glucose-6-phosphate 1-dehydrogenase